MKAGSRYRAGTREGVPNRRDTRRRQENYSVYAGRAGALREAAKDWIYPGEIEIGQLYMLYAAALQLTPVRTGGYGKDDGLAAGGKLMGYAAHDLGRTQPPPLYSDSGSPPDRAGGRVPPLRGKELWRSGQGDPAKDASAHQLKRIAPFKDRVGSLRNPRYIALAGEAQRLLEQAVLRIAEIARDRTSLPNVCFAGGTALNITALTLVMDRGSLRMCSFSRLPTMPATRLARRSTGR